MKVENTELPGVLIIVPDVYSDARGCFMESWNQARYAELGAPERFVQDNVSVSSRGVLRGLHYQHPQSQGKLAYVLQGEVYDVAVDIRPDSPTFRRWAGVNLSAGNSRQLYIPAGYAHGFYVISESALFVYKCTDFYDARSEGGIRWDDPDLAIDWPAPVRDEVLSPKDRDAPRLAELPEDRLPRLV